MYFPEMQGIRDVIMHKDDILVTGKTDEQHLKTLEGVNEWTTEEGWNAG